MKSVFERIRKYVASDGQRNRDRAQPAYPPPERSSGSRTSYGDPYAEMRRVLATTMLLG
jgi:hypothetical protein